MDSNAHIPELTGLSQRLKGLIVFRLVFALVLVLVTIFFRSDIETAFPGAPAYGFLLIASGHLLIALLFYVLNQQLNLGRSQTFAFFQIVWDLVFSTVLIYVTGGIESPFKFLYWLTIAFAAILLMRKGAWTAAFLSGLFYGALVNAMYFGLIPPFFDFIEIETWLEEKVRNSIGLHSVGFFVVAHVFSNFARTLQQTETILEEKTADLEDLEVLMGRIVESLTSGLITLESSGRIGFWSRAAEEITGLNYPDVRGRLFWDVFPDAKNRGQAQLEVTSTQPKPWRWEMNFRSTDGTEKILGFSVTTLRQKENDVHGKLIIFQDLTEFREMEDRIKYADRMAVVGELAARMAHEIRNPLTSVSGAIEVLQKQEGLKKDDRRLMDIVVRETDRLNQLLTDFLFFARPTVPQFEDVRLDELVAETVELFSKSYGDGKVKMTLNLEPDVNVHGDPKRLSQMFWNLMKNASEAMPEGGEVVVSLGKDSGTEQVAVEIRDHGNGIPADIRERIFDPFFTTKTRGTGLGLATVRQIAEEHHGGVSVRSDSETGAIFRVMLPGVNQLHAVAGRA